MVKEDYQLQLLQSFYNDLMKLENMPQYWTPEYKDLDTTEKIKRTCSYKDTNFGWMGFDGSDFDYCERNYDAWGVVYECPKFVKLEEDLSALVAQYRKKYPNSTFKAEVNGFKGDFYLELECKYNETQKTKKGDKEMSEKGLEIIKYLQTQPRQSYTAKEIAGGMFVSPRSVPGAMVKLANDGYIEVEKIANSANKYKITDKGFSYTQE
jgi:DNA-binding MarR family transcriptional regulator